MSGFDAKGLASRVAGLIRGPFGGDVAAAARALDADPDDLRRIVEDETDSPNIDLLARLVKRFGVDACWLVTGEYDWRAHMRALQDEADGRDDVRLLLRLVGRADRGRRVMRIFSPRSPRAADDDEPAPDDADPVVSG